MSVRKFLMLSAAGIASVATFSAYAGGPEMAPEPISEENLYFEANFGYARVNWEDILDPADVDETHITKRGKGGFTFGFDMGYAWNKYISAELGWYYLPKVEVFDEGVHGDIKSWFLYAAGKLSAPLTDNFDIFFKGGLAYRRVKVEGGSEDLKSTAHTVRPLFGLGLEYDFDQNWLFNIQWLHVGEGTKLHFRHGATQSALTPAANLITGGFGYKFVL